MNNLQDQASPGFHIETFASQDPDGEPEWQAVVAVRLASCPLGRGPAHDYSPGPVLAEQVDLINALYLPEPPVSYAIRCIAYPNPASFAAGRVEICLFGKVSAPQRPQAEERAAVLARQLLMQLGGTFPDYFWQAVSDPEQFRSFWQPFDWQTAQVAELRRREEQVKLDAVYTHRALGFMENASGSGSPEPVHFVHPFLPRPGRFERLLRIMLLNEALVTYTVTLAPTRLAPAEEQALLEAISRCEGFRPSPRQNLQRIHEQRARMLSAGLMDQLMRLQDAPYSLGISLASPAELSPTLAEAAGVAISAPVGEGPNAPYGEPIFLQTGGYDVIRPANEDENQVARNNLACLAQQAWGPQLENGALHRMRSLVDAHEASSAFRFPEDTGNGLPGIEVHARRVRPLPREVATLAGEDEAGLRLLLGTNNYLGQDQKVYLPEDDRRTHMYVVGQTGTGKSTLLKTMILSDMQAGRGLALVDPHGDLFEEVLGLVPPERLDDVVIFDPSDLESPVGFNLLECADEEQRHFVVREMRAIMRRLLEDMYQHMAAEYTGPIFYQHMQMNMLLAMSDPNNPGTLLEFYQIYQSRRYWRRWLPLKWSDAQLRRWVEQSLESTDYTDRRNPQEASLGEYLSAKFIDFIFDPRLRIIFGQKHSTIDLKKIMDEGKILLVNLAKGLLGEANAQFLGLILMAKIQAEVMARAHQAPADRHPFYLYVDEFQSLATENFTVLLSEARKFGVGLVLVNQFISQIKDPRIIQAVFGNVGTLLSFRLGREDAETIEPQFLPYFNRIDLSNLPNWQACVKATIHGQSLAPFTLQTVLPTFESDPEIALQVRQRSAQKYGRPRAQVEQTIADSLKEPPTPAEGDGEAGRLHSLLPFGRRARRRRTPAGERSRFRFRARQVFKRHAGPPARPRPRRH